MLYICITIYRGYRVIVGTSIQLLTQDVCSPILYTPYPILYVYMSLISDWFTNTLYYGIYPLYYPCFYPILIPILSYYLSYSFYPKDYPIVNVSYCFLSYGLFC